TPYVARSWSMKATITSVGGRAPPARNTPTPCARSRWPASARAPRAPTPSPAAGRRSSRRGASRHRVRPGAPTGATLPPCSPVCRRSLGSPPTVTRGHRRARRPSARRAHATREHIVFLWTSAPSSLGKSPPINPGRFTPAKRRQVGRLVNSLGASVRVLEVRCPARGGNSDRLSEECGGALYASPVIVVERLTAVAGYHCYSGLVLDDRNCQGIPQRCC